MVCVRIHTHCYYVGHTAFVAFVGDVVEQGRSLDDDLDLWLIGYEV